ncbi:dgd1 suppressor 1 [Wolffia australiana]
MESAAPARPLAEAGAIVVSLPARLWKIILSLLPSSDSRLLRAISKLFSESPYRGDRSNLRSRRRLRNSGLPLPLHSHAVESALVTIEASRVLNLLDDIFNRVLESLHIIRKNLEFWESRAEGTYGQKVYFMVFERGPKAFLKEAIHLTGRRKIEGSAMHHIHRSAASSISEKISTLTILQSCLASFLAEVYAEVDKYGQGQKIDLEKLLPSLLMGINDSFTHLEETLGLSEEMSEIQTEGCNSNAISFEKIPEINVTSTPWTDSDYIGAINMIYRNLNRLDLYIGSIISKCRKPRRLSLYWLQYTCGAIGLSLCTMWLLRHSRLMGSSDIDNWIREAKESTVAFWKSHVEEPLLSIRDELFETFRRRHKGVIEKADVQLSENSLHRMLLAFSEQTKGQKFPEDASDQEMLEIVMSRYEKELAHPIQNLIGGELPRALLIQVQKLKLDVETAMLELDQILKANEINFAILAALPAFFLSVILFMLARAWVTKDKGAEGRGRIARIQRRLLVVDVEKKIMEFQMYMDQGLEEDAQRMFGLVLYRLDRLYRAVESHAKATNEWSSLRKDIIDLGKPGLPTPYKLSLTSRIHHVYDCMLPSRTRF